MDNLISYAHTYENFYKQPILNVFHAACSCVVGQQVAFNVGRSIRTDLYKLCGYPLSRKLILGTDLTQIKNLTLVRIQLLKNMAEIDDERELCDVLLDYSKLKGFGQWTFDAVSILLGINSNVNLSSDSYICKNLSLYIGLKLTRKECHEYIAKAGDNQTKVCYLLWRLKPKSISKITQNLPLNLDDFV